MTDFERLPKVVDLLIHDYDSARAEIRAAEARHEHASNDIANNGGILDRLIPRERLRAGYGEGWNPP